MGQMTPYQKIREAVESIRARSGLVPQVGILLGSGLGSIIDEVRGPVFIPYEEIPHFHSTAIEGHAGRLVLGMFHEVPVVFLQGRLHIYEGYPMEEVVFPTRTVCGLGIHTLILTNAAGGVNPAYRPADLMLINDHINLMGDNPLRGVNLTQLGPRFPDLSEAYNHECLETFLKASEDLDIPVHTGVYAGLLGPTYETPAEVRMLHMLGVDAVGMSTVPEAVAANHLGVRVAGISCITNRGAGLSAQKLNHKEVIQNVRMGAVKIARLLGNAVPRLVNSPAVTERPQLEGTP